MLAGLLFATHDAEDRPDRLTATLPFGGATLIEYQARQLVLAGASQIIIIVARLTPELMGAIGRIGKRGVAVDAVRSAAEASEKLHPLARVVMLADGLVATDGTIDAMAHEGGDALLVVPEGEGSSPVERLGGGHSWAGVARLEARRVAEVAALPREYDPQSTLIRIAAAAGAATVPIGGEAMRAGHGIEHAAGGLQARARGILSGLVAGRRGWFDRFVLAPVARWTLPTLVSRAIPAGLAATVAGVVGLIGAALVTVGWATGGLLLVLAASLALLIAATLGTLRDERALVRSAEWAAALLPALAALLLGRSIDAITAETTAVTIALALIVIGGLGERAILRRRSWWGSPPAYLFVVMLLTAIGWPTAGLALAALYATATLAAAIEHLREQP